MSLVFLNCSKQLIARNLFFFLPAFRLQDFREQTNDVWIGICSFEREAEIRYRGVERSIEEVR
jgi:hypothetical protein